MTFFWLIAMFTFLGDAQEGESDLRPLPPFVVYNICPFECCTYQHWRVIKEISLRKDASTNSPSIIHVKQGVVEALTGNVYIQQLGEVTLIPDRELEAMGDIEGIFVTAVGSDFNKVDFQPPYTLFVYSPIGEGEYNVWYRGEFYHAGTEPLSADVYLKYMSGKGSSFGVWSKEIISEWWVKVRTDGGVIGWTNEVDNFAGEDQDTCS